MTDDVHGTRGTTKPARKRAVRVKKTRPADGALIQPAHLPAHLVERLAADVDLPWPMTSDQTRQLIRNALLSASLSLAEKDRVLRSMPGLSSWQVQELLKVFEDERREFAAITEGEWHIIANLQAQALWNLSALLANRADTSPALERAWRRRTLRRAASAGLRPWLDDLPADWWGSHPVARWAYRDLFERGHPACEP